MTTRHRFQLSGPDLVHWPVNHPLSCGERGREIGQDGAALSCFRCIENFSQDAYRVKKARTLRPKHARPRPSAYRIVRVEEQHDQTNGFHVASVPRTEGGRAFKGLYFIFRSNGRGHVDLVVRPAGGIWSTDDADTAEVLAQHLNSASEAETTRSKRPPTSRPSAKKYRNKRS